MKQLIKKLSRELNRYEKAEVTYDNTLDAVIINGDAIQIFATMIHKSCQTRKLGTLVPRGIVVLGNSLPFNCFYDIDCFTKICYTVNSERR